MKGIWQNWLGMIIIYVLVAVLLLPWGVTWAFGRKTEVVAPKKEKVLEVFLPKKEKALEVCLPQEDLLEQYIIGVVAAEMPVSFSLEALKAQAVAARTYTVRELGQTTGEIEPSALGQAYSSMEELQQKWGENYDVYLEKVKQAVGGTKGEIMVYEEEPILAVFHAQSGGQTEVSENIWEQPLPYLQSVDSKEDEKAPHFLTEVRVSATEVATKCGGVMENNLSAQEVLETMEVLERSKAGYVTKVKMGQSFATGRQIRQALGLRSTNFTIKKEGTDLIFTTKGYGHGGGMSQYGASFMAQEGKTYREILSHYYQGVSFSHWNGTSLCP